MKQEIDKLIAEFRKLESMDGNDPIRCSRMHFGDWADRLAAIRQPQEQTIDIVFDGPPSPPSGRFVEVESPPGKSIRFGEWLNRGGLWVLRFKAFFHPAE